MSYTPPPPPEVPPNRPSVPSPLPAPEQAVYQQAPAAQSPYAYAADPSYPPGSGYTGYPPAPAPAATSSGCRWGCIVALIGIFAMTALVGVLVLNVLTSGANAFGGIGNGIGSILNIWGNAFNPQRRAIVVPEVVRLQKLQDLTTVKFNYAGVVTVRQDVPPALQALYGNEQTLVAVVSVRAGIDLSTLSAEDVTYDEATNTLTFRLPSAVLQECFMDDSKSYVVENRTGIFVGASPALSDEARRYSIQQFRDTALEEKILQEAQTEAETVMREFMSVLNPTDGPTLQFIFKVPDPNVILPETCR